VTRLRNGQPGFETRQGQEIFSSAKTIQTVSGADPVPYSLGTVVLSPDLSGWGVMLTTHLHLVEVKNERSYTSTASIRLQGVDRANLTFNY
jgi:hypothetical protein